MILYTGKMWIRVPQVIGIELRGSFSGAAAKDLAIHILKMIPFERLNYRVVEIHGAGVASLTMDDRFCLSNMLSEGGVKSCLVAGDQAVEQYMKDHARGAWELVVPDADAEYEETHVIDLSSIRPMVSLPHHPTNGDLAEHAEGVRINQAFLGSCTNGRLEDLRVGAAIVRGKKIHPDVRFVVTPASWKVYRQALDEGLIRDFLESEAMITNPSCGACIGASSLLAPGEVCVATSNRNFRGRMGSVDAAVYLASPETVAKSALAGYITTK
jgi:3-isopropylmalate/(R)-2-methylmalate dehydratase large subunit